jgi:hypothetical protein
MIAAGSFGNDGVGSFPEGDATSRWLIDTRIDLSPLTVVLTAAVVRHLRRARAIHSQNWRV